MDLNALLAGVECTQAETLAPDSCTWDSATGARGATHYNNRDESKAIDFEVEKLPFNKLQVMDPRLVRIAPAASNERHRHAHESIFVVLAGEGEILIGKSLTPLRCGSVVYVPRWVVHQSYNRSSESQLLLLAITDFGFTSAVLGDYDSRTRLKNSGADAFAIDPP